MEEKRGLIAWLKKKWAAHRATPEKFDPIAWWQKKRDACQETWEEFGEKGQTQALAAAKDESDYRSGELREITHRMNFSAVVTTALMAAYFVLLQMGGNGMVGVIIAKTGMAITGAGAVAMVRSYRPRRRSRKDRKAGKSSFIDPEIWTKLMRTPHDTYTKELMRTKRKTKPLDRYKDLLGIVCDAQTIGIILLVVAFLLRGL